MCINALVAPKCLLSFPSDVVGEDRAFTVLFYAHQTGRNKTDWENSGKTSPNTMPYGL